MDDIQKLLRRYNCLFNEIDALYHEAAVFLGLSDSALLILYSIQELGEGCALSDIYKRTGVSRQTVHSAIRKLEKEGVLYLEAQDGRSKAIYLTDTGREKVQRQIGPVTEMERAVYSRWTEEERQEYLRLTERFCAQFREELAKRKGGSL